MKVAGDNYIIQLDCLKNLSSSLLLYFCTVYEMNVMFIYEMIHCAVYIQALYNIPISYNIYELLKVGGSLRVK